MSGMKFRLLKWPGVVIVDGFTLWLEEEVIYVILNKRPLDCEVEYTAEDSVDGTPNILSTDLFPLKSHLKILEILTNNGKLVDQW